MFIRGPIPFFGHILVGKIWLVPAPFSDQLNYIYIGLTPLVPWKMKAEGRGRIRFLCKLWTSIARCFECIVWRVWKAHARKLSSQKRETWDVQWIIYLSSYVYVFVKKDKPIICFPNPAKINPRLWRIIMWIFPLDDFYIQYWIYSRNHGRQSFQR